jgi:hypothetical protein
MGSGGRVKCVQYSPPTAVIVCRSSLSGIDRQPVENCKMSSTIFFKAQMYCAAAVAMKF